MKFIFNNNISTTKKQFVSFLKQLNNDTSWNITNETLYKLCRKYPEHKRKSEIIAKAIIIGRVYAASLERGDSRNKKKGDEFYHEDVFTTFKEFFNRTEIRMDLKKMKTKPNMQTACLIHSEFVNRLKRLRKVEKTSFASKYLHFHFPKVFYILDSRVKKSLPIIERYLDCRSRTKNPNRSIYSRYVARFETVRDKITKQTGVVLSPRQLDTLLIKIGNSMNN